MNFIFLYINKRKRKADAHTRLNPKQQAKSHKIKRKSRRTKEGIGERKVVNKYYPPDFEPSKPLRNRRQPKKRQICVRLMLPINVRCDTCGNYISPGTKFNSRKEEIIGKTYLGIKLHRFYFKCPNCSAEIIIRTDPQTSSYVVESGSKINLESTDKKKKKREREEDQETVSDDAMTCLEKRASNLKRETDNLAALDEIRYTKRRHASVSTDVMLEDMQAKKEKEEQEYLEKEEELIKLFRKRKATVVPWNPTECRLAKTSAAATDSSSNGKGKGCCCWSSFKLITVKKKHTVNEPNAALQSLHQYG